MVREAPHRQDKHSLPPAVIFANTPGMSEPHKKPDQPTTKPASVITKETVLDEHADGAPHITVDDKGHAHHYMRGGCQPTVKVVLLGGSPPPSVNARHAGPARVTSDAFRSGWDAINWGTKGGEA